MTNDRRRTASAALAGLDAEIGYRRAELAVLERARDTIARDTACCDTGTASDPCTGVVHVALCRACGFVARRCTAHGAQRAATHVLRFHEHQEHGSGWAASAATDDTRAVSAGGPPVPVGELPASPAAHGGGGPDTDQRAFPWSAPEPGTEGE